VDPTPAIAPLAEHFFRHEYGRLVASLSRRVGVQHIEAIEDAVQSALMAALETWKVTGPPGNPSAWLFRAASNAVLQELRRGSRRRRILERRADADGLPHEEQAQPLLANEIEDDLLRMLFICCDAAIPQESQLVLALKTLCGFDVREISLRLFTTEANVYKRLGRARARLRSLRSPGQALDASQHAARLGAVHGVLYLLFTEGHLPSHARAADAPDGCADPLTVLGIRRELCDEAIRLTSILAQQAVGQTPQTHALLALMHLHAARICARQDASGGLLLLEEQDRGRWDMHQVELGLRWLAKSARGDVFSRYHAEAAIAAEHCMAPCLEQTRWDRVVESYELLERITPSPLHRLNRALAVAQWHGPRAGLAIVQGFEPPAWLAGSYLWAAALADLHRRCGDHEAAAHYRASALALAPNPAVAQLLQRRLGASVVAPGS